MSEKKVSLCAGEVKYLLSRAIRFGHRNPKVSVETLISSYIDENLNNIMIIGSPNELRVIELPLGNPVYSKKSKKVG